MELLISCYVLLLVAVCCGPVDATAPEAAGPALHASGAELGAVHDGIKYYEKMADLVVPYGYKLEEHFVQTSDGYILRLFRMPAQPQAALTAKQPSAGQHRRAQLRRAQLQQQQPAPIVHLQHGLLGSSSDWVLNGPGLSLPFILADAGYDVWLGNVRGNTYSRNHTTLPLLDARFWAFSWDEMAAMDLPAMMDYELQVTGAHQLSIVGHSQGTTITMAALASIPDLAAKVSLAVLLAPVAFVTHVDSVPLVNLAKLNTDQIFLLLGIHELLPSSEVMSKLNGQLCKYQPALCVNLLAAICGYNPDNLDTVRLPRYLNYTPSGTSVQNLAHWSQAVRELHPSSMPMFDYGTECQWPVLWTPRPCNQEKYGSMVPPKYNLSYITTPLAIFTGGKDRLSDPLDVELLLKALPHQHVVAWENEWNYEHLDFIWGINACERVYRRVLELLAAGVSHLQAPVSIL